ncbi:MULTISPECIES: competence type IV pilus minor pilin ComGG [unclassified Anoxybacillus]|uniref:competence type IV pilus minor pilin ComGG n=1 Tax=unclassified Anoxybacillus TaxID=2639704 RepID=UPI0005CDA121|nr:MULTISPECIES: competence type IV pilus minor pilin ComGG [unclassified Anoxybacillus]
MRNEKGMIFPMTVMFSCVFLFCLLHVLRLYEMELEFAKAEQQSYEADSLMQMAVVDIKASIASHVPTQQTNNGMFVYPNGRAEYSWQQLSNDQVKAKVSVFSNEGVRYTAEFTVSFPNLELLEWKESL